MIAPGNVCGMFGCIGNQSCMKSVLTKRTVFNVLPYCLPESHLIEGFLLLVCCFCWLVHLLKH